ncbi:MULTISPECIES: hypothetical protein [unclassified Streptomyces]|uniref:hypothetical protein n=1 Tax=unclassified Streptomyces TaxID=2593676 RepID=UPI0035D89629
MTLTLTVPSGRTWMRDAYAENHRPRSEITNFCTLIGQHSDLQEPHGGTPCQSSLRLADDHYIARKRRRWEEEDGPRGERGTVTITLRLEDRDAHTWVLEDTVAECNLQQAAIHLVRRLPDGACDLSRNAPEG